MLTRSKPPHVRVQRILLNRTSCFLLKPNLPNPINIRISHQTWQIQDIPSSKLRPHFFNIAFGNSLASFFLADWPCEFVNTGKEWK